MSITYKQKLHKLEQRVKLKEHTRKVSLLLFVFAHLFNQIMKALIMLRLRDRPGC